MEEQTVWIGSFKARKGDANEADAHSVSFIGEELAIATLFADNNGTWERRETLFRAADGRLLVYVQDRSQAQVSAYSLHEATKADLGSGGRFSGLGQGWWFLALPEVGDAGQERVYLTH